MRTWYFSEMAYHPAWEKGLARGSLRVNFPSENLDPEVAGKLLNRYLDEFALCDEAGIDIMVNEHHSTATCMTVSVPMALSVIARETKKARLLSLGNPIANRPDPCLYVLNVWQKRGLCGKGSAFESEAGHLGIGAPSEDLKREVSDFGHLVLSRYPE